MSAGRGHRRTPYCRGPRPVAGGGRFIGRIDFRGDHGYLRASARHVFVYRTRTFKLDCRPGHADDERNAVPGLFGYVQPLRSLRNADGTYLRSAAVIDGRVAEFWAIRQMLEDTTTFRASVMEWLPGHVAATRWVERSRVAGPVFELDESERHPRTAAVDPPAPFGGEAVYSRADRSLRGDLRASFLGEEAPFTGSGNAEVELCRRTPQDDEWLCR